MPRTLSGRLSDRLRARIESGELGPGSRLPTEAELMRTDGVSRTTARRALDALAERGLVRREPGAGSVVAGPVVEVDLPYLWRLGPAIQGSGQSPGGVVLVRDIGVASEAVAVRLEIAPRDPVLHMRCVCSAGGLPLVAWDSFLSLARFPQLGDADLPPLSLLAAAARCVGGAIRGARYAVAAAAVSLDLTGLLELRRTAPVLMLDRVVHVGDGTALETARVFPHPSRCRAAHMLAAPPPGSEDGGAAPSPG